MQFITFSLLSLGAIAAASDAALELQMAKLIPRETWQAWQKRDNILQGGGWALVANSCPLQSTQCTDATCCPNSLLCNPTSSGYNVRAVCCPDAQDCSTALASTPFCADASWDLWETSAGTNSNFCCLPGQIGLQSIECVSGKQAVASSLSATSLGLVTAGAVYQTGAETKASGSVSSPTGSGAASTITSKATTTTIEGGSIESGIKSIVSGVTHNGGNNMQKGMAVYAVEGIMGAIAALLL